jgi:hypothetical protein
VNLTFCLDLSSEKDITASKSMASSHPVSDEEGNAMDQDQQQGEENETDDILVSDDEISFTKQLTLQSHNQIASNVDKNLEHMSSEQHDKAVLLSTAQDILMVEHFKLTIPLQQQDGTHIASAAPQHKEEIRNKLLSLADRKQRAAGYRQYLPDTVRKFMRYWRCGYGLDQQNFTSSVVTVDSTIEERISGNNENEIAVSRVFDGNYEIAVPTSCLVR